VSNKSILQYISGYINRKRYGIKTGKLSPKPLINTYIANSSCIVPSDCNTPEPCDDDILYKVCNFYIAALTKQDIDYYKIKVIIPSAHNGVEPYTVEWIYDESIYELVEETQNYIILNRVQDAEFETEVFVKLTDKTRCFAYGNITINFVPIEFTVVIDCPSTLYVGTFIAGEPSSGTIVVPYTITGYGNLAVEIDTNVHGFSGSLSSFPVTPGNGNATFPIEYDGTEPSGIKAIPIKATYSSSATVCNVDITVDEPVIVLCTAAQNVVIEVT